MARLRPESIILVVLASLVLSAVFDYTYSYLHTAQQRLLWHIVLTIALVAFVVLLIIQWIERYKKRKHS